MILHRDVGMVFKGGLVNMGGSDTVAVNSSSSNILDYATIRRKGLGFDLKILLFLVAVVALGAGVWGNVAHAGNNAGAAFSLWPDTGQTKCYDNDGEIPCPAEGEPFYGQDAQYQGPKRSYTKLGYGGVELPDSATPSDGWIMTRDNVTGLIWEIKTNKDGTKDYANPHDADNTYTWCDHNPDTSGGDQGTCGDGNDTGDFINALNAANFGGFSDWRLPTVKELSTLVNSGIPYPGPTIDAAYFPNTVSSYWSSTTVASSTDVGWRVYFSYGSVYTGSPKNSKFSVRAVRSGQPTAQSFVDNHDGTITDKRTGLMWQKCTVGQTYNPSTNGCDESANTYTWQEALEECESLELAGYDDWRLPNRNELQSIVDYSKYDPAINTIFFPNTMWYDYWSSTTTSNIDPGYAWPVYFDDGGVSEVYVSYGYKHNLSYVRCVRSGQGGSSGNSDITTPPRRITPDPVPQPSSGSTKAVVITHGWNSNADGWVLEMAKDICDSVAATSFTPFYYNPEPNKLMLICYGNGWDVYVKDWRDRAYTGVTDPMEAYVNAITIGNDLGKELYETRYSHIHFIAHSAGSNLIDFATKNIKVLAHKNGREVEIHETFLDAYDPRDTTSDYGSWAEWSDNYVDTRPIFTSDLDATRLFLKDAYNVDVTSSELRLCGITCRHDRPVRFYGKSISWDFIGDASHAEHDPIESTDGVGFPLSLENAHSMSGLNQAYPKGKKCIMDGSTCYQGSLPPGTLHYFPSELKETTVKTVKGTIDFIRGTGATLLHELRVILAPTVYSYAVPSQSSGVMAAQEAGDEPTEEPAWIIFKVTTEAPVNTLKFNWKFDEGGEGFLRIFVDDRLVREMDQRFLLPESTEAEEVYIGDANGTLPAGEHEIAFRLDGFSSNGTSGVELTDVELLEKELSAASVELGDANGDGQINVLDVISVINKILNPNTSLSGDADCNGDGIVNVLDVICIINKILQEI